MLLSNIIAKLKLSETDPFCKVPTVSYCAANKEIKKKDSNGNVCNIV